MGDGHQISCHLSVEEMSERESFIGATEAEPTAGEANSD
jgi:hypothetical protein